MVSLLVNLKKKIKKNSGIIIIYIFIIISSVVYVFFPVNLLNHLY